jgi:predicted  nucleic acid-binding Zn-ribbon protein
MTPLEFLTAVWPSDGFYAIATPFVPQGSQKTIYTHKVSGTIAQAAAFVEEQRSNKNIFFCVHSLKERSVFDPTKMNYKTGKLGAFAVRLQRNMLSAKAFFFDLDVGESEKKYGSQAEALASLKAFCASTHLPRPMIVSSGGGLHVYWLLDASLPSEVWRAHASKLRQLAKHYGLLADPARTTDTASVLRVVGTSNLKGGGNRPVRLLLAGATTSVEEFVQRVDAAIIEAGMQAKPVSFAHESLLEGNLNKPMDFGPPPSLRAVAGACSQVQWLLINRAVLDEPQWYTSLNIVRHCENGINLVHKVSADHPGYDHDQTDKKVEQLIAKGIRAATCSKLAEVCGDEACETCPFHGKIISPLNAAKYMDEAPPPVVLQVINSVHVQLPIPDPPFPYKRTKSGISMQSTNKDDEETHQIILAHDLYPIRRVVDHGRETEQQLWRVVLPRQGEADFALDADALYDRKKFVVALANRGVYPKSDDVPLVQNYMIAYINKLQAEHNAEAQHDHLGWSDDYKTFVLATTELRDDGTSRAVSLSVRASRASEFIRKRGTLERQVELMQFYNHKAYLPNQFALLAMLGAPIFYATGHHGVVLNMSGPPGASKSTTLYAGGGFYGEPELYAINGTKKGMSELARNARVETLANLPICVDEITKMPAAEAVDLVMGITQPTSRKVLDRTGVERASIGGYKATIATCTANNSLHGLLSTDNATGTAGSMRVFEMVMVKHLVHTKLQADDFWHELKQNFGHIGEAFLTYVIQHREEIEQRVRAVVREIDAAASIDSGERFHSAVAAAAIVAGEIAYKIGLLPYDVAAIRHWVIYTQIPYMRGVVSEEYDSPIGTLADYLETIHSNILISRRNANGNLGNMPQAPRGEMLAHLEQADNIMWVLKKGFKDYCVRIGANSISILDELSRPAPIADGSLRKIVIYKHQRRMLGQGTELGKSQSWCFGIDMTHPEVTGVVDMSKIVPIKQPKLKLV